MLFDDIIYVPKAIEEHKSLYDVLHYFTDGNCYEFTDILAVILKDDTVRKNIINECVMLDKELYNILKCCMFYIGPDSGTLHIASMLRKPVIGLFATSNPERTGPFQNIEFIINKYPEALKKYNKKLVSDAKWGERIRNKKAMSLIKVDDGKKKIDMILRL